MNEQHRKLVSEYTTVIVNDEEEIVNGMSLLVFAAMTGFESSSLGSQPKDTGCTSSKSITMISKSIYLDKTNGSMVEDSEDLSGQYDITTIANTVNTILRKGVINELTKNNIPVNELNIKKGIQVFRNNAINNAKNEVGEGSLLINLSSWGQQFQSDSIADIRLQFRECASDQYFFIPLSLVPFVPLKYKASGHANGILISKAKGTVYRIEPQYGAIPDSVAQQRIDDGIIKVVNEIGLKDPILKKITVKCPQAVVNDKNCIFWSTLIFEELVKNMYKGKNPDEVIQEISSKPKEVLQKLIYDYKKKLFGVLIPNLLKKLEMQWPEFEKNQSMYLTEINSQSNSNTLRNGGKKYKKGKKTKRNKKIISYSSF